MRCELLDLLPLHVFEARVDSLRRLGLFALDPFHELALAPTHAFVELVERAPPLGRVRLDLCVRGGEHPFERLVELGAQTLDRGAQLLALRRESVGVGGKPQLGLGDELLLPLAELGDVQLGRLRGAVEILRPAGESLLDLRLRVGERLGERSSESALALRELASVLLAELALLVGEQGHRVGPRAGERALELRGASFGLALDEGLQAGLRLREMRVRLFGLNERAVKRDCGRRGERAAQETARCDGELARMRVAQRECEPGADRGSELDRGKRDEREPGEEAHRGTGERERGDADTDGEDDVEGVCQQHRPHRRGAQPDLASKSAPASSGSATASSWSATSAGRADAASPT